MKQHLLNPDHPIGHLWLSLKSASWWTAAGLVVGSIIQLLF